MSIVMAMLEWPSRSCTIFGWTFSANIWEAWLCRIPCNRTAWPRDFRKYYRQDHYDNAHHDQTIVGRIIPAEGRK